MSERIARRAKANPDINARQFRATCHDEGFAWLGGTVQKFVDLRFRVFGRYILPVRNARGQILHAETLTALRASRAASEQEREQAAAEAARKVALAARLAPQAMPKPRAGLTEAEAIAVMADDLRHANARESGVKRSDMLLLGWTRAQLDQYGDLARQTAYQLEGAH
jgi:hypothetical protein